MPPARKPVRRAAAKKTHPAPARKARESPAGPRRSPDLQLIPLDDGYLALRPKADRVHRLNASAALTLELASGEHTVAAIAARVAAAYGLRRAPVADVQAVLDQMAALGLVTGARGARRR